MCKQDACLFLKMVHTFLKKEQVISRGFYFLILVSFLILLESPLYGSSLFLKKFFCCV